MLKLIRTFYLLFLFLMNYSLPMRAQCLFQEEASAMLTALVHHHYAPLQNNLESQERVVRQYLHLADPRHVLYTEKDVQLLLEQSAGILDTNGTVFCQLVPYAQVLHRSRLERFNNELNAFLDKPMEFKLGDTLQFIQGMYVPKLRADDNDRQNHLHRTLRLWYLLDALSRVDENGEGDERAEAFALAMSQHDVAIRNKMKQSVRCKIDPDGQVKDIRKEETHILQLLFESIAEAHDPHTNYFSNSGIQEFVGQIQSDQVSYGISIGENEVNEKVVAGIRPGSEAWRGNQVHLDDRILGVWLDNKPMEGLDCMSSEALETAINNGTHRTVKLQLSAKSGEIFHVVLRPELVETEENMITSLVLKNDSTRIGYIALPAFYSSAMWWIDKGCANDVGKEILKLKKDGIQGLILDLRDNGGGDVAEAIDLVGLFIDVGPIGMQKERDAKPAILKELSKGTLYDGPLAVLVNNFSASASEIVAAALQDYHRAVIVGHATFGKATSQRIRPVVSKEEMVKKDPEAFGYLKVTTGAIHRITSHTHQNIGVLPDVDLPNPLIDLDYHERNYANPLNVEAIEKKLIYTAFPALPIDKLMLLSEGRMQQSPYYQELSAQRSDWPKRENPVVLHPNGFIASFEHLDVYAAFMEELDEKVNSPFEATCTSASVGITQMDEYAKELFNNQINSVSIDVELQECFNIVIDLIKIKQN